MFLQVPEGLYKSLSEERQRGFEQITVDFEFAPVECFLKSIFDLAVLCTDLALDLINGGGCFVVSYLLYYLLPELSDGSALVCFSEFE